MTVPSIAARQIETEAARELVRIALDNPEVTCVIATALVTNRASWRVMEKVGMSRVRQFVLTADVGFADPMATYAICREGCSPN